MHSAQRGLDLVVELVILLVERGFFAAVFARSGRGDEGGALPRKEALEDVQIEGLGVDCHEVINVHNHEAVEEAVFTAVGVEAPVKRVLFEGSTLDRAVHFLVPHSGSVAQAVALDGDLVQRSGEATRSLNDGVEQRQVMPFS